MANVASKCNKATTSNMSSCWGTFVAAEYHNQAMARVTASRTSPPRYINLRANATKYQQGAPSQPGERLCQQPTVSDTRNLETQHHNNNHDNQR